MFAFIAREPILDREKDVFAYELLFRDGNGGAYPEHNPKRSQQIAEKFYALGLDDISGEKASFINFSPKTLIEGLPSTLNPESVIIELADNPATDSGLMDACKHIKNLGFKIAVDDPLLMSSQHAIFPLIDIVKVDVTKTNYEQIHKSLPRFLDAKVQLVAEHVRSHDDFVTCRDLGFDFFQGYFFAEPTERVQRHLPASKMNLVDLMGESSNATFNLERINQIIERDAALSFLLLKFINNPTINKRYKITSLRHALNYMGEVEIKKFIALLSLANLSDDKPIELIHMSLVRAKFFDLLSQTRKQSQNPPMGFLVGLFSLLEALLDQSMTDILAQIPLIDEVKDALEGKNEEFNAYLSVAKAFESAIWLTIIKQSRALGIDQKELHSLYNQAIVWGNGVRQSISAYFPRRKTED
ncbi:EAL domain-containing protein [Alteromonas sediminis]|uniref:EAL domain-containing protein n=1 Tax=Alteromonas sediminis TaxID=2259342 RepID=A0A3N5Y8P6_9ALTE|nr:EAL domain-containing protein [Alteromonas sediminis]RPJ64825.1 EAL domain-containing protein [Alteromonas sediminis]